MSSMAGGSQNVPIRAGRQAGRQLVGRTHAAIHKCLVARRLGLAARWRRLLGRCCRRLLCRRHRLPGPGCNHLVLAVRLCSSGEVAATRVGGCNSSRHHSPGPGIGVPRGAQAAGQAAAGAAAAWQPRTLLLLGCRLLGCRLLGGLKLGVLVVTAGRQTSLWAGEWADRQAQVAGDDAPHSFLFTSTDGSCAGQRALVAPVRRGALALGRRRWRTLGSRLGRRLAAALLLRSVGSGRRDA